VKLLESRLQTAAASMAEAAAANGTMPAGAGAKRTAATTARKSKKQGTLCPVTPQRLPWPRPPPRQQQ
jgi:hypothetical protein